MAALRTQGTESLSECAIDAQIYTGRSLGLDYEGSVLLLRTSDSSLSRSRTFARISGLLFIVGALYLVRLSLLSLFLIPIGLVLLCRPKLIIRPTTYAVIDFATQKLLRPSVPQSTFLNIADIRSIRGMYEVQGWDSRCAFYAQMLDSREELIATFTGTDDMLVKSLCLTLGKTLHRPSSYTGLFGEVLFRYEPAAGQSQDRN